MPNRITSILASIRELQDELETVLSERAERFSYSWLNRRAVFQQEALRWQKQFKKPLWLYVFKASFLTIITAPITYSLILPFILLDLMVSLYQLICFPVYKIPKVKRRDYIVFDRRHLAYLNLIEKMNCAYCSYGNGVSAYVSEVAARTEAYWCPIKHAGKMPTYHSWYGDFSDYGDAENFELDLVRNKLALRETPEK